MKTSTSSLPVYYIYNDDSFYGQSYLMILPQLW
jgi:hypothetical protein